MLLIGARPTILRRVRACAYPILLMCSSALLMCLSGAPVDWTAAVVVRALLPAY